MDDTNAYAWIALALPAVAAFFCLAATAVLASLIKLNKGAKLNRAWGLLAAGLACVGLAALDLALESLDLPNAASVRDGLAAFGALLAMIGAVYARGVYRDLLK